MKKRESRSEMNLQQWLNHFSEKVDYKRFQRGMKLYHEERIRHFRVFPNHFECLISGNHMDYEVAGYYRCNNGLPEIKNYEVTCSCPDDVSVCKHSVCATMYFILNELSKGQAEPEKESELARETLIEQPLKNLEMALKEEPISIIDLSKQKGSRTIENHHFVAQVHDRILIVMDELEKKALR